MTNQNGNTQKPFDLDLTTIKYVRATNFLKLMVLEFDGLLPKVQEIEGFWASSGKTYTATSNHQPMERTLSNAYEALIIWVPKYVELKLKAIKKADKTNVEVIQAKLAFIGEKTNGFFKKAHAAESAMNLLTLLPLLEGVAKAHRFLQNEKPELAAYTDTVRKTCKAAEQALDINEQAHFRLRAAQDVLVWFPKLETAYTEAKERKERQAQLDKALERAHTTPQPGTRIGGSRNHPGYGQNDILERTLQTKGQTVSLPAGAPQGLREAQAAAQAAVVPHKNGNGQKVDKTGKKGKK